VSGAQPLTASHYSAGGTRADLQNSFAGATPPMPADLAIVRGSPFLRQVELNPVQRLNSEIDEREFAACVLFAVLLTVTFGAPLAIAVAFMSFG
jgi:hypothetical protein